MNKEKSKVSKIIIKTAITKEEQQILHNLSVLYQHDMASFFEFPLNLPSKNGFYGPLPYFDLYWKESNRFPFLFLYANKPIGFALVNTVGTTKDVQWNMAEFFIVNGCRRRGFGLKAATQIIEQFQGVWEIAVVPENKQAVSFWRKTLQAFFSNNDFVLEQKMVKNPKPHPMKIFRFKNDMKCIERKSGQVITATFRTPQEEDCEPLS